MYIATRYNEDVILYMTNFAESYLVMSKRMMQKIEQKTNVIFGEFSTNRKVSLTVV